VGSGEGLYKASLTPAMCSAERLHQTQDLLAQVGDLTTAPDNNRNKNKNYQETQRIIIVISINISNAKR
jgi:hypothetical protein